MGRRSPLRRRSPRSFEPVSSRKRRTEQPKRWRSPRQECTEGPMNKEGMQEMSVEYSAQASKISKNPPEHPGRRESPGGLLVMG